jgi:hypothetical protein
MVTLLATIYETPILNEVCGSNDGAGGTYSYVFFNSDNTFDDLNALR